VIDHLVECGFAVAPGLADAASLRRVAVTLGAGTNDSGSSKVAVRVSAATVTVTAAVEPANASQFAATMTTSATAARSVPSARIRSWGVSGMRERLVAASPAGGPPTTLRR